MILDYSNEQIIDGFIQNDRTIIKYLYESQYPVIHGWIKKNSGNEYDANDIFHETFLIILRKLKKEKLTINCCFTTYFFSISKHLWLQELRKRSRIHTKDIQEFNEISIEESDTELEEKKLDIFLEQINRLETKCRDLMLLHCQKKSLSEIKNLLGFINTQAVADKKKNCRKKLIQNLLNCKEYKELQSEVFIKN